MLTFSREELYQLVPSGDRSALSQSSFHNITSLGLLGFFKTSRGYRGGIRRSRRKTPIKPNGHCVLSLVNARSFLKNGDPIADYVINQRVDLLVLTETWLSEDHSAADILKFFPAGFSASHRPRCELNRNGKAKRGGGLAIVTTSTINTSVVDVTTPPEDAAFEKMEMVAVVSSQRLRLLAVYRPPAKSFALFLSQCAELLESVIFTTDKLLIVGDFNVPDDMAETESGAQRFTRLTQSFGLVQHVKEPTHQQGHTLDLVFSRACDNLVARAVTAGLYSDDHAILCHLRLDRPPRPVQTISFRPLKNINLELFTKDVEALPLIASPAATLTELVAQFHELTVILNRHAPLQTKTIVLRRPAPWWDQDVRDGRRRMRKAERRWRKSRCSGNLDLYRRARRKFAALLAVKKATHWCEKITESRSNQQALYKLLNGLLGWRHSTKLPVHTCDEALASEFSSFFSSKVEAVRRELDSVATFYPETGSSFLSSNSADDLFREFLPVSEEQVKCLIRSSPTKSCALDPIPTSLLKRIVGVFAAPITRIINCSLASGVVPSSFKKALITPLLKNVLVLGPWSPWSPWIRAACRIIDRSPAYPFYRSFSSGLWFVS